MRVDVLNGVNLSLLGQRDPAIYGSATLSDLETQIYAWARGLDLTARCRQTNHEGEFVEWAHQALSAADALILNPGAWTHYSWAIRDAVEPFPGHVIEVHISKVEEREQWRRFSVLEDVADHRITGQGFDGYRLALEYLGERRTT